MFQNTSLVITSISAPNAAMKAFAEGCMKNGIEFIVVGDTKSPSDFTLEGCRFAGIEEQRAMPYKIAKLLPERHYGRKNLGYLMSKHQEMIMETDDDNLPRAEFWNKDLAPAAARHIDKKGWINAYRFFSEENIWPRGIPLEELQANAASHEDPAPKATNTGTIKIFQGLADENPDVDAVYRMTMKLPIKIGRAHV